MNKQKSVIRILLGCVVGSFFAMICTTFSFAWFFSRSNVDSQVISGEVGLRDYFYQDVDYYGDGSIEHPYEIVTVDHLYNLTRLQNLGVFSEQKYFRIGHDANYDPEDPLNAHKHEEDIFVLNRVNGELVPGTVLDFTDYFETYEPFLSIGNEGSPFYGIFDGRSIPLKGLKIGGNPQDVGLFGYTAHSSTVQNIICANMEVISDGYPKKVGENPTNPKENQVNFLYASLIEDIFDKAAKDFETASVSFTPFGGEEINCKIKHSISSPKNENLYNTNSSSFARGTFTLKPPTISVQDYQFEYSLLSSTKIIQVDHDANDNSYLATLHLDRLPDSMKDGNSELTINDSAILNTSLSVVASVKIDGVNYSRVIQSYEVEFKRLADLSGKTREEMSSELLMKIDCKYYVTEDDKYYSSDHGYNIGFIVGHADGNVDKCYVYNGALKMNTNNGQKVPIAHYSEKGLIGRVGDNVTSNINPAGVASGDGDTGVLNFSYIYSKIRQPFAVGDTVIAGYDNIYTGKDPVPADYRPYVAYAVEEDAATIPEWDVEMLDSFADYSKYLRSKPKTTGDFPNSKYYITYSKEGNDIRPSNYAEYADTYNKYVIPNNYLDIMNSVDFTWNQVIEDEELTKRGLGVFKVVTGTEPYKGQPESLKYLNNIGDFSLHYLKDENAKKAIYFSTAECDWAKTNKDGNQRPTDGWSQIKPARMNTLPTYSDSDSFKWPFSRDFNYVFKLDLGEASKYIDKYEGMKNYMFNTDSVFLQNYLQSKLRTNKNQPVEPGTKAFGFKVQFSQDTENKGVTKLDSYLKVGIPGARQAYQASYRDEDNNWETKNVKLPPKSIVFEIENDTGANVAIAGNGGFISIYGYNPDPNVSDNIGNPVELYTMYSKNDGSLDSGRYFAHSFDEKYEEESRTQIDEETGKPKVLNLNTKTIVTPEGSGYKDSSYLYGHIFFLPKGHYVVGASNYLRSNANDTVNIYYVCVQGQTKGDLGELDIVKVGNTVADVDFLLKDPTSGTIDFDDESLFADFIFEGNFTTGTEAIVIDANSEGVDPFLQARFNDCVTYLAFSCYKEEDIHYTLNGVVHETDDTIDKDFTYGENYTYSAIVDYWDDLVSEE